MKKGPNLNRSAASTAQIGRSLKEVLDSEGGAPSLHMLITVIICTRDRAESLPRTLDSLLTPVNLKSTDWELLVIDNGSRDRTPEVCRQYQQEFATHFRFTSEKRPGKSNALNTAVVAARGDLLAFTDDDVFCAPTYLTGIRELFVEPSIDAAQGRIILDCECGWPAWMDEGLALSFGHRDCGPEVTDLVGTLDGCNTVVRAHVFDKIGGFSAELGPGAIGLWEDTEFSLRMRRRGLRQVYAPQILVHHELSKNRVTKAALRKRFFQNGRATAYYEALSVSLPRFGLYLLKAAFLEGCATAWDVCRGREKEALLRQCAIYSQAGLLWQHYLFSRGAPNRLTLDLPLSSEGQVKPVAPAGRRGLVI